MEEKFVEIEDLKVKSENLFKEAENYRKNGILDKAIYSYDEFLKIRDRVKDYSRHYDAYLGMYLTWSSHLKWCIEVLDDISKMLLTFAPKEAEYKDIWVNNLKEEQQKVSSE